MEGGYWAICPEIPGANSQGETIGEANNSLQYPYWCRAYIPLLALADHLTLRILFYGIPCKS
ncbi:MAG: type II toxin-antitoxin system HicB family antitoxin [Prochlorotrichaceae cyanobacterium]